MANNGEKVKTVADFIFLDSKITVDSDHSHRLKDACSLEEKLWRTSIQLSHSVVSDSATRWTAACQASLSITNSWSLLKLISIESVMPSNHLILCRPLFLPAFSLSQHQGLSDESALLIWWPKHWNFSFSISPSNEYSGLISFRRDWLDLLAVQGILKSLLQHYNWEASIFKSMADSCQCMAKTTTIL